MSYFSRRNKHIVEFSGYEEASEALRSRILSVFNKYVGQNDDYSSSDPWFVEHNDFVHEVHKEFPGKNPLALVTHGLFHETFTVVEIFLNMVQGLYPSRVTEATLEIFDAFDLSGSVYSINKRRIELRVDEQLAKKIEETKSILTKHQTAYEKFFEGVGDLVARRAKSEDVVKDLFVAFEDYLKGETGAKDYGSALGILEKRKIISPTQKSLMEKIYAYRSDTYGVGHAGNSKKPEEVDALWFLETITPQIVLINRKLQSSKV